MIGRRLSDDLGPTAEGFVLTHRELLDGVLVSGAMGSGKTTVVERLLQSAIADGIPVVAIDLSGDLSVRLVDAGATQRPGFEDVDAVGSSLQLSSVGLADALRMFSLPEGNPTGEESVRELTRLAKALLASLGYRTRGRTPELALVESVVFNLWSVSVSPDLGALADAVESPPFDTLGVFDLERAVPRHRRTALATAIRSFVAAANADEDRPEGVHAIEVGELVTGPQGEPHAAVFSFNRRSLAERKLLVAIILSKLATWAAGRSGDRLSAIVIVDDVGSIAPPSGSGVADNVLSEMADTWEALGVATVLTAEHVTDLRADILERSGTWVVGRLPVQRTRQAVVDELDLMTPPVDAGQLDSVLSSLQSGKVVVRTLRHDSLRYMTVR